MIEDPLLTFWIQAEKYVIANFPEEVRTVEYRKFSDISPEQFFYDYVYVVLNSGMKNQIAEKMFHKFCQTLDATTVGHPMKRSAIELAILHYKAWFEALQSSGNKLDYLDTLPMIGPITKYHLARNLGLDYAKPDRHLVRLAEKFGYSDIQAMCEKLAAYSGWRVGTVDVILWRYSNMKGQTVLSS